MNTQYMPSSPSYGGSSDTTQRPLRDDLSFPMPSSFPSPQDSDQSPLTNGTARTTSKRRRPNGSAADHLPFGSDSQPPAAPEVPKAPPLSYPPPYGSENYDRSIDGFPASFAERVRVLTGNSAYTKPSESDTEPSPLPVKPIRRGSLNRPIGGLYSEIQQHKRDSYPPVHAPISPRRFSNSTSPREYQAADPHPTNQRVSSGSHQQYNDVVSKGPKTSNRRVSANSAQPTKKEWAPDRSPLQKLEVKLSDISKEEKRARMQVAEQRLRDSQRYDGRQSPRQEANRGVNRAQSTGKSGTIGAAKEKRLSDQSQTLQPATHVQQPENYIDSPFLETQAKRSSRITRPERRRESLPTVPVAEPSLPLARDSYRRSSAKETGSQPERGVRFQGEGETQGLRDDPQVSYEVDPRDRSRGSGIEALARSDEAHSIRREKLRQDTSMMGKRFSSREIPGQQQNPDSSRTKTPKDNASTSMFASIPDSEPQRTTQGQSQATNHNYLSQTAAGAQARGAIGFESGSHSTVEAAPHRKHHLSKILHRSHNHTAETPEESDIRPKRLDEWRRAGTARLTAADFEVESDSEKDQGAWWEKGRSGSRRKQGQAINRTTGNAQSLSGEFQNETGKFLYTPTLQNREAEHATSSRTDHVTRTRPYVKHEERQGPERLENSHLGSYAAHFWHRSRPDQTSRLASAYSYSCSDLALHDPLHDSHFCEPYLSNELTLSMRSVRIRSVPALTTFDPPLYLKCGPLLRYTGLKRDRLQMTTRSGGSSTSEREIWRGSVMIVTSDADSAYEPVPTLRLFSEPMELLPLPQPHSNEQETHEVLSEFVDPVAGLPKLSRSGKTIYVKPVDDLEQGRDLSHLENDDGLFEETRTAAVPTAYGTPDYRPGRNGPAPFGNSKAGRGEGRARNRGQQVKGVRLHAERGVTFWRFNLEVELLGQQTRIAYSINNCPAVGFWVPARGHSMNMMFHSCNGFSMSVNPDNFSGPDPLWRDVLNSHQVRPFHVMIGGGDQIYNDAVMTQSPLFREWLEIKNPHHKHQADFTPSMREELQTFYLERYLMWFSQGLFGMANSQIPMVNMWDDHGKLYRNLQPSDRRLLETITSFLDLRADENWADIIDGFGSYPHHFMSTPVFCGLGAVAFKYYMLFQHQSVPDEGPADEPSWLMGAAPGPYINELSRSIFLSLGKNVSLLALDCRMERMASTIHSIADDFANSMQREEVLSEPSYQLIFERCRRELIEGETKHLILLLGVPIAYPRLVWLENLLTSSVMAPVKALGRAGLLGGFLNKFDGGVEILDDLDDHWTARHHKQERNWFIQELQELAAEKSIRVTILGGDVHLAAVGQFYSNPKLAIPKDRDHRYMANIVSSAIVNTPPPNNMADILNRRNKTHHLDDETDEDMIPMFTHDVNGSPRKNKNLLPRRNWCSIREYHPGTTPSPTPPGSESHTPSDESPPPPPTRLQRTLSLTRGDIKPGNLIRRFSKSGPPPSDDYLRDLRAKGDKFSDSQSPESPQNDGYFPQQHDLPKRAVTVTEVVGGQRHSSAPLPRPGGFHRRPTNMSEKAATKGATNADEGLVNLEHGLDIVLNCEINQKDPAGHTVPYRLIVPALYYEGHGDENTVLYRKKSLKSRIGSFRGKRKNTTANSQNQWNSDQQERVTPSLSDGEGEEERPRRWSFSVSQRRQYRDQTPPLSRERLPEVGNEGTRQQRQSEHRDQQMGQTQRPAPFRMPPSQQMRFSEPTTPLGQSDQYDGGRQDSVDYHTHLESSPPGRLNGYSGRKPSKVHRMLGVENLQRNRSSSLGNANGGGGGIADTRAGPTVVDDQHGEYDSEDYDDDDEDDGEAEHAGNQGKRASLGYSGIEAYSEKNNKGWRRLFGSKVTGRIG